MILNLVSNHLAHTWPNQTFQPSQPLQLGGIFPLHQLNPDFSKDESDTMDQPCCSGWLHLEELETGGPWEL
jgi:hypothetical protein